MPRTLHRLYLNVKDAGSKSWTFLFTIDGSRKALGLGPYPAVSLAMARKKAEELRAALANGNDPRSLRAPKEEPTFATCVDRFLSSMEGQWRNEKHRAQWRMTLGEAYCRPLLKKKVASITTEDVLKVLSHLDDEGRDSVPTSGTH